MICHKYCKFSLIVFVWIFAALFYYVVYFGSPERSPFHLLISYYNSSTSANNAPPLTYPHNPGRLGNQMFTYAALFGLCSLNKRRMQIMPSNYDYLSKYFDIQTPIVNLSTFVKKNPWIITHWLREQDSRIPLDSNIIGGVGSPNSYTFFHQYRQEVSEIYRFKPSYVRHAQSVIWEFKRQKPHSQVYVGVHVRRRDYLYKNRYGWLQHIQGREVDMSYFEKAVEHFTSKYANVTFIAVSDDKNWCRANLTHLGILTVPDSPSAGHDMALLAECNHTIMTYGTFSFWGAYLAGGHVVYFSDFVKPNTWYTKEYFKYDKRYLPEWIGISTTKTGFWESSTTSQ